VQVGDDTQGFPLHSLRNTGSASAFAVCAVAQRKEIYPQTKRDDTVKKFKASMLTFALLFACSAHAQTLLTEPMLQSCATTEGSPTTPWVNCSRGVKFVPISDGATVSTGDFTAGTWQRFGTLDGATMVAVCPKGALLETEARCRTADGAAWATRFVRKDSLASAPTFSVTYRWNPVTQYDDGTAITDAVRYVLTWYAADGVPTDVETAGPPLVLQLPMQSVCARLKAVVGSQASDPTAEICIAPAVKKPGMPANVTVEFGSP
jgi:hypothetical protein